MHLFFQKIQNLDDSQVVQSSSQEPAIRCTNINNDMVIDLRSVHTIDVEQVTAPKEKQKPVKVQRNTIEDDMLGGSQEFKKKRYKTK